MSETTNAHYHLVRLEDGNKELVTWLRCETCGILFLRMDKNWRYLFRGETA